jgi:hypothetical protein
VNKSPKASTAVGVALVAIAVAWIAWTMTADAGSDAARAQPKGWFTVDDGATWFADLATKSPPFQTADGKTAVKAVVFKCGHGKTFVAYLERLTPAAQLATQPPKDGKANPYAGQMAFYEGGTQVKAPKTGSWVSVNDPAATKIITPVCPEGSSEGIELVDP